MNSTKDWICYECAAKIVNAGNKTLSDIWGVNNFEHKEGNCHKCGKVDTLCHYPSVYVIRK